MVLSDKGTTCLKNLSLKERIYNEQIEKKGPSLRKVLGA